MTEHVQATEVVAVMAGTDADRAAVARIAAPLGVQVTTLAADEPPADQPPSTEPVHLLIIVTPSASDGERQLLHAYRQHGPRLQGRVRTLLLCDGEHAADAYASCRDEVFDDYLVFHPLQDEHRVRLAIHQALHPPQDVAPVAEGSPLAHSIHSLQTAQSHSRALRDATSTLCERTLGQLDDGLRDVPGMLRDQALLQDDAAYQKLVEFFQAYRNGKLQPVMTEVRERLHAALGDLEGQLGARIDELSTEHHGIRPVRKGQPQVLVVAGDKGFRMTLCQQLMHEGYDVSFAETGTQAIMLMSREQPKLVLMEVQLQDPHGIECIRLAKKLPLTRDIPIVMLAGENCQQQVTKGLDAGASGALDKPIRYGALKTTLDRYAPLPEH